WIGRGSITIQPYPNIEVSTDKTLECKTDTIPLKCCIQVVYQVEWGTACSSPSTDPTTGCIFCNYTVNQQQCKTNDQIVQVSCQLKTPINGITNPSYNSKSITLNIINKQFDCFDSVFGAGIQGDTHNGDCAENMDGYQVAQCNANLWNTIEDHCVLLIFVILKEEAKTVPLENIPQFMFNISSNATSEIKNIVDSPDTILTLVETLTTISSRCQAISVNQPVMTNFLKITDVIGSEGAINTWVILNKNSTTTNASSVLLNSTESIARRLLDENANITTNFSSFNKLTFSSINISFSGTFGKKSTTQINIPMTKTKTSLTVIISSVFNNILPVRNLTYNSGQTGTMINGDVAMIETNSLINNISLSFDVINKALGNPQCVFWNFNLLNGVGGWDSTGCQLNLLGNETKRYTCECNHTTSFSILMSPFMLDKVQAIILDYITYIGVGISMGSLVLCLIIEIIIWKSVTRNDTSYMRHVTIVNIAVSLLIANICVIIGAAVVKQEGPCSTATFFMHFFYLALFFWMLLSALLLLYRTLMVFSRMTRGAMMAIGFTVGYGAPLIIAVITVASTAGGKGYIQQGYNCWLNWNKTKALLAFVIPALTIVAINLLVLIAVLFKMLRRGGNASTQPDEKHPLVVIARCVASLTPLFGLTWGFGIGTLVSRNFGIHVVFAFLNSLQGFFILVFGTLLDSKVREAFAGKFLQRNLSSGQTRSTTAGPSSSSGFPFFQRLRQRNVYNISSGSSMSSSNSDTSI
ncbi:adhesion G-protein coupled receptor F1-like, partial [Tachysurus fulvidraco]|uniref:adhesion G-protein coupled receptor F1-like n=1 Tax=Tachysurus fulvidraco TaxID=1234273 RepID=UPI001FED6FAE